VQQPNNALAKALDATLLTHENGRLAPDHRTRLELV